MARIKGTHPPAPLSWRKDMQRLRDRLSSRCPTLRMWKLTTAAQWNDETRRIEFRVLRRLSGGAVRGTRTVEVYTITDTQDEAQIDAAVFALHMTGMDNLFEP